MNERTSVELGDELVTIERPTALKASRAFAILRGLSGSSKTIATAWGEYVTSYEAEHFTTLDRTQARVRFPPRPVLRPDTMQPVTDEAGALVLTPSVVDSMTEEDWKASGNVLKLPDSPAIPQVVFAILPEALDAAEDSVYRLLALFTISNQDVKRHWRGGSFPAELDARTEWLLDTAFADELVELAVVVGEVVDTHFRAKVESLGASRVGKALRVIGLGPEQMTPTTTTTSSSSAPASTPTDSRPTSFSDGPESSDGASTTPSTPRSTSSPDSPTGSTTSATSSE